MIIIMVSQEEHTLTKSIVLFSWGLRFLVGGKRVVFSLQFRILVEYRRNVDVVSMQPSALQ